MQCLDRIRNRSVERSFELAGRAMLSDEPGVDGFVLVHGLAAHLVSDRPKGGCAISRKVMLTAWIELADGRIYDPVTHEYAAIEAWRRQHRPQEMARYTRQEAAKQMRETRHYGPWWTIPAPQDGDGNVVGFICVVDGLALMAAWAVPPSASCEWPLAARCVAKAGSD